VQRSFLKTVEQGSSWILLHTVIRLIKALSITLALLKVFPLFRKPKWDEILERLLFTRWGVQMAEYLAISVHQDHNQVQISPIHWNNANSRKPLLPRFTERTPKTYYRKKFMLRSSVKERDKYLSQFFSIVVSTSCIKAAIWPILNNCPNLALVNQL